MDNQSGALDAPKEFLAQIVLVIVTRHHHELNPGLPCYSEIFFSVDVDYSALKPIQPCIDIFIRPNKRKNSFLRHYVVAKSNTFYWAVSREEL